MVFCSVLELFWGSTEDNSSYLVGVFTPETVESTCFGVENGLKKFVISNRLEGASGEKVSHEEKKEEEELK